MLLAACHSKEGWTKVEDFDRLSNLRETSGNLLWVEADVANFTEQEIATVAAEFDLHPLAVEDAVHTRQRPKLEVYPDHLFLVVHQLDEVQGQLEARQIACFIGERYVLTIHDGASRVLEEAKNRWREYGDEAKEPGHLVHTVLDAAVDNYQRIADDLENTIEELEDRVLGGESVGTDLYLLKQRNARLRRYAIPLDRALGWIVQHPQRFPPDTEALFRDVDDHITRIADQVKSIDELMDAVLDLIRSREAATLNQVILRLTGWGAVIAAPTLIASVYGMNFDLVPEDGELFGFWFALSLMIVISVVLYRFFRRRGWI